MDYRTLGVRRTIAIALGLSPALGCTPRVVDDEGVVASSGASMTGDPRPNPTTGGTDSQGTATTGDDESSSGFGSTGFGRNECQSPMGYPFVDFCMGEPQGGVCECDDACQWQAVTIAVETFPSSGGCGYYPAQVACETVWGDSCCYTVTVYEDVCGKGRPLLVDGHAQVAEVRCSADWTDASTRLEVPEAAAYWLRAGLEEHASVASFARFALELVAVGAPPELLADCAAAMRDEVRHAELAFGLARYFGAERSGPGPLDSGPARSSALRDVVVATVREGCIGETLAAAQAELAATRATEPSVVAALREIAADEARHAALAWRVVQWALSVDPSLRAVVSSAFAEADALQLRPADPFSDAFEDYGVLSGEAVAAVRARTLDDTVRPFAAALLTTRPSTASCTL